MSDAASWDARYSESDRLWSGKPNPMLVREAADAAVGRALDLGCGEGADAIWLASRGWSVTAVDISRVALRRAAEHAEAAGADVAARIDWQQCDLAESFPDGKFDLVSAQFLHSHGDMPREAILRRAAGALAPGGVLLIAGHSGFPPWEHHHDPETVFPTPDDVIADLELADGEWEVLLKEDYEQQQTGPDGEPITRTNNVVKVRRLPG